MERKWNHFNRSLKENGYLQSTSEAPRELEVIIYNEETRVQEGQDRLHLLP